MTPEFGGHSLSSQQSLTASGIVLGEPDPVPPSVHSGAAPPRTSRSNWAFRLVARFPRSPVPPHPAAAASGAHSTVLAPSRPLRLQTFALLPPSLAGARTQPPASDRSTHRTVCLLLSLLPSRSLLCCIRWCCAAAPGKISTLFHSDPHALNSGCKSGGRNARRWGSIPPKLSPHVPCSED